MKQVVIVGVTVLAGAALIEAALIPGLLIGGAAVLAPRYLPKLPNLIRRRKPSATRRRGAPVAVVSEQGVPDGSNKTSTSFLPKIAMGQAVAKTITYRLIVTTLDFTTNYIVIGELATAAGLSTFNLVAGPLFYFAHEAAWNYVGHPDSGVAVPLLDVERQEVGIGRFTISRALAKTIVFRTLATAMDFTTNFVVVRDVTQAAILSSTGFVLGPFVYYGHEKAWDYFSNRGESLREIPEQKLLPAPV
jgi:uncharacterized membrane protein